MEPIKTVCLRMKTSETLCGRRQITDIIVADIALMRISHIIATYYTQQHMVMLRVREKDTETKRSKTHSI